MFQRRIGLTPPRACPPSQDGCLSGQRQPTIHPQASASFQGPGWGGNHSTFSRPLGRLLGIGAHSGLKSPQKGVQALLCPPTPRQNPLPRAPTEPAQGVRGAGKGRGKDLVKGRVTVAGVHSAQGCLLWGGQQSPASRGLLVGACREKKLGAGPGLCFPDSLSRVRTWHIQVRGLGHTGGEGRCP